MSVVAFGAATPATMRVSVWNRIYGNEVVGWESRRHDIGEERILEINWVGGKFSDSVDMKIHGVVEGNISLLLERGHLLDWDLDWS